MGKKNQSRAKMKPSKGTRKKTVKDTRISTNKQTDEMEDDIGSFRQHRIKSRSGRIIKPTKEWQEFSAGNAIKTEEFSDSDPSDTEQVGDLPPVSVIKVKVEDGQFVEFKVEKDEYCQNEQEDTDISNTNVWEDMDTQDQRANGMCIYCKDKVGKTIRMRNHLKERHPNFVHRQNGRAFFRCQFCARYFEAMHRCWKHMRKQHADVYSYIVAPSIPCTDADCTAMVRSYEELKEHIESDRHIYPFTIAKQIKKLNNSKAPERICAKASSKYHQSTKLTECHAACKAQHKAKELFKCGLCEKKFKHHSVMVMHESQCRGDKRKSNSSLRNHCDGKEKHESDVAGEISTSDGSASSGSTEQKRFQCAKCSEQFNSYRNLFVHSKNAHNDVPDGSTENAGGFLCKLCPVGFSSDYFLRKHTVEVHHDEEYIGITKCNICAKTFLYKRLLQEHIWAEHDREKRHMCQACGRSYLRHSSLRNHIISAHPDNQVAVVYKDVIVKLNKGCKICGATFRSEFGYKSHMMKHTGRKSMYTCATCEKKFGNIAQFKAHTRTHTKRKIFRCPVCLKMFVNEGTLHNHLYRYKIHGVQKKYTRKELMIESEAPDESDMAEIMKHKTYVKKGRPAINRWSVVNNRSSVDSSDCLVSEVPGTDVNCDKDGNAKNEPSGQTQEVIHHGADTENINVHQELEMECAESPEQSDDEIPDSSNDTSQAMEEPSDIKIEEDSCNVHLETEEVGCDGHLETEEVGCDVHLETEKVGCDVHLETEEVGNDTHLETEEDSCDVHLETEEVGFDAHLETEEVGNDTQLETEEVGYDTHLETEEVGYDAHLETEEDGYDARLETEEDSDIHVETGSIGHGTNTETGNFDPNIKNEDTDYPVTEETDQDSNPKPEDANHCPNIETHPFKIECTERECESVSDARASQCATSMDSSNRVPQASHSASGASIEEVVPGEVAPPAAASKPDLCYIQVGEKVVQVPFSLLNKKDGKSGPVVLQIPNL